MILLMFQHFLEEKNNYMAKIYLISPPNFDLNNFAIKLEEAFKTGLISMFQLRIKNQIQNYYKEKEKGFFREASEIRNGDHGVVDIL